MKDDLVTQPTAQLTRKQFWGNISKGTVILLVWAVGAFTAVTVDPIVSATLTGMAGAVVGYFVKDRANVKS